MKSDAKASHAATNEMELRLQRAIVAVEGGISQLDKRIDETIEKARETAENSAQKCSKRFRYYREHLQTPETLPNSPKHCTHFQKHIDKPRGECRGVPGSVVLREGGAAQTTRYTHTPMQTSTFVVPILIPHAKTHN